MPFLWTWSTSILRSKKSSSLDVMVSQLRHRVSLVRIPYTLNIFKYKKRTQNTGTEILEKKYPESVLPELVAHLAAPASSVFYFEGPDPDSSVLILVTPAQSVLFYCDFSSCRSHGVKKKTITSTAVLKMEKKV